MVQVWGQVAQRGSPLSARTPQAKFSLLQQICLPLDAQVCSLDSSQGGSLTMLPAASRFWGAAAQRSGSSAARRAVAMRPRAVDLDVAARWSMASGGCWVDCRQWGRQQRQLQAGPRGCRNANLREATPACACPDLWPENTVFTTLKAFQLVKHSPSSGPALTSGAAWGGWEVGRRGCAARRSLTLCDAWCGGTQTSQKSNDAERLHNQLSKTQTENFRAQPPLPVAQQCRAIAAMHVEAARCR